MSNLRVCIVAPLFHPHLGGPGRQAYTMVTRLKEKGFPAIVITRRIDIEVPNHDNFKIYRVSSLMPKRYTLSEFTFKNFLISMSFSLGAMIMLASLRKRYDIVQFYGGSLPLLICLPLLKILNKKIVVKLSGAKKGMEAGSLEGSILKPFLSPFFSSVDRFIAVSEELKNSLLNEKYPEKNIVRIPNGVDVHLFYSYDREKREMMRKSYGLSDRKIYVYTGRLTEGKGLETLVDAMKSVADIVPTAYLLLLGDGEIKDKLKEKAKFYGVSDKICFKGNVDNVSEFLNLADFFVFPSYSEGLPNSLLEAMACGLPVIASRIGGVIDVVEDGKSGTLFEPGDVAGLSSAMIKLLKDDELSQRLGIEARKRIMESFSIDKIADEYIKLYKTL